MKRRQPLPRLWMMTDERQGDALWAALGRLPRGAGVVFRHYRLAPAERRQMFTRVAKAARRRGLVLIAARPEGLKISRRIDGVHNHARRADFYARVSRIRTAAAHNMREARRAEQDGADLIFLSPVYPTASHPGAGVLGPLRFGRIAGTVTVPVVALGGMNKARARRLAGLGAYGWAGIDAWSAD